MTYNAGPPSARGQHQGQQRRALTNALPMAVNSGSSGFSRRTQQNASVKPPQLPAGSISAPGCRSASASGTYLDAKPQMAHAPWCGVWAHAVWLHGRLRSHSEPRRLLHWPPFL